jgi:hypothetical protein
MRCRPMTQWGGVAVMSSQPAAFMSYARVDDEYEDGLVSQLRKRLSGAVRAQTGDVFPIFQDREDIQWTPTSGATSPASARL